MGGRVGRHRRRHHDGRGTVLRVTGQRHFVEVGEGHIDGTVVEVSETLALLAVGLVHRFLDGGDGLLARQDARNGEEASLHDGVDAPPHACVLGHFIGVDDPQLESLFEHPGAHGGGQTGPHRVGRFRGVEQEHTARRRVGEQIVALDEHRLVTGHKAGHALLHQIAGADVGFAEAQVRHRHRAGFLRVVNEVALGLKLGGFADDLDRVLVGRHGAVGTEPPEHRMLQLARGIRAEGGVPRERQMGHVVHDADRELAFGLGAGQLVEHRGHHARREFLAGQPETPADHPRHRADAIRGGFGQRGHHILVERLALRAGLLAAVEHGDGLCGGRNRGQQRFGRQRTEQAQLEQTDLLATRHEVLHGFFDGFGRRPHHHDHAFGIRRAHVVEQPVMPTGELAEAVHGRLHDGREGVVERVGTLAGLEEHVRILGRAAQHRMLGRQGAAAMRGDQRIVDHRTHGFGLDGDDLGHFMGRAEAVEEVDHRNAPGQSRGLGDQRHVLGFLHRVARQERAAGGATGHHVGVIAEDRQRMGRQRAGGHMEHEGRQFARHLVQVGHEQQQPLTGGKAGAEGSGGERAVKRTGGAAFRLHFDDLGYRAPQVLLTLGRPFVGPLAHVRRRCDRVDGHHLAAEVGHPRGGFVAVEIKIRRHCDSLLELMARVRREAWISASASTPALPVGMGFDRSAGTRPMQEQALHRKKTTAPALRRKPAPCGPVLLRQPRPGRDGKA